MSIYLSVCLSVCLSLFKVTVQFKTEGNGQNAIVSLVERSEIKCNNENVIIGAIKRNTSDLEVRKGKTNVGKQCVRSLYLFEITK